MAFDGESLKAMVKRPQFGISVIITLIAEIIIFTFSLDSQW